MYAVIFFSMFLALFWLFALYLSEPLLHSIVKKKFLPSVSIIIPAYNEEKYIGATLKSILALDYPKGKLEIIVVANACTDKTVEIVRKFKQVRLIETPLPGKARAQNLGLKYAKNEFVAVVDADMHTKPDALLRLMPHMEDKNVAQVIPAVKAAKPENLWQKLQYYEYVGAALYKQLCSGMSLLFVVPGAFDVYRKSIIQKLGGFDEHTLTEDIEIATRLQKYGYTVKSDLDVEVFVPVPDNLIKFHKQRLRWSRGLLEVIAKHKDMLFNSKYGLLGEFMLPVTIILPFLILPVYAIFFTIIAGKIQTLFLLLSNIGLPTISRNLASLKTYLLSLDALIWFSTVFFIMCGLYILSKANTHLKTSFKYPGSLVVFFMVYPIILSIYWILSIAAHFTKVKRIWR
jgi:cellulose synthase/poly-beta-1,6-N-acetylglucosamine synthase-like glycosyltransferase